MIKQLLVIFLLVTTSNAKAQSSYGVQLGADYDVPIGKFSDNYKPVTAYHVDVLWFADEATKTINFTFGYNTFKPKEDIFYFLNTSEEGYGSIVYSDYKAYTAYIGWMRNFALTEKLKVGAGFNLGAYISHYINKGPNLYEDFGDINAYLAAKTGFSYDVSDHIQLNVQAKYNGFSPTGKNDPRTPMFNGRIGTVNYTWSSGLAIAYKF